MTPRVSIIIPCWHAEKYIERALRGILAQTFTDYEVIFAVDNADDDRTVEIINQITPNSTIIERTEKINIAAARNLGVVFAKGEYLAFLDADDEWLPGHLEVVVKILDSRPDLDAVYSRVLVIEDGKYRFPVHIYGDTMDHAKRYCPGQPSTYVVRKEMSVPFDERIKVGEDWKWLLDMQKAGRTVGLIRIITAYYHWHDANFSRQGWFKNVRHLMWMWYCYGDYGRMLLAPFIPFAAVIVKLKKKFFKEPWI